MIPIETRARWGAAPPVNQLVGAPLNAGMAVHYEGVAAPRDHALCAAAVRGMQRFHTGPERRWSDIAYSFVVCIHGLIYEGRGWGRRTAAQGTPDGNARWHAVCAMGRDVVGVVDLTDEQRSGIRAVIDECGRLGHGHQVEPHSHFHATACPGDEIRGWVLGGYPDGRLPKPPAQRLPALPPVLAPTPIHPGFPAYPGRLLRLGVGMPPRPADRAVSVIQRQLAFRGWRVLVDGRFGRGTDTAVRGLQRDKGLHVDGIVGPATHQAIFTAPIT